MCPGCAALRFPVAFPWVGTAVCWHRLHRQRGPLSALMAMAAGTPGAARQGCGAGSCVIIGNFCLFSGLNSASSQCISITDVLQPLSIPMPAPPTPPRAPTAPHPMAQGTAQARQALVQYGCIYVVPHSVPGAPGHCTAMYYVFEL